jgi:hypothetical protein
MVFLGVMCLVEDQQVDIFHPDVRIQEALVQDIGSAHYYHALAHSFLPYFFAPKV